MSRLIALANTVLSTKLPDLTCACSDLSNVSNASKISATIEKTESRGMSSSTMDLIEEDVTANTLVIRTDCYSSDLYKGLPSTPVDADDPSLEELITVPSVQSCDLENGFAEIKLGDKEQRSPLSENKSNNKTSRTFSNNRRLDFNNKHNNFIEDESGFSSMSSFQEIGIPIISIIPPSPCKEVAYVDDIPEIMEEAGNWKNEIELNNQAVKVFWV
ncbi:hypothetical protein MSG28_000794 [Choristoneura fumiferana]|uniref:Uncharacterized protein n=2 Tax=Choristoneura fumiferana TaxID=7141 RepID=A0ACC0K2C2_CHOFU|nr:hypothetical protein MSG28_000794 [Choristoneura fumiferana]